MATERTPMYCVKCGQATYDAMYCDNCRCVFCPDSDKDCSCSRCQTILNDSDEDGSTQFCNLTRLPHQRVCHEHFCPVCLTEHKYDYQAHWLGHCRDSSCSKFRYFIDYRACKTCGHLYSFISPNFNCVDCECLYCDNIHCIVHKCLLCDMLIWFNDPDLKYCKSHACKQCLYEPVVNGKFCAKCSVNRTVGTQTKRAN